MRKIFLLILGILILLFIPCLSFGQFVKTQVIVANEAAAAAPTNMISNGTFDDDTGWNVTLAAWTIGSGVATNADVTGSLYQLDSQMASEIQPSTEYKLTFTIAGTSGGGLYITIKTFNEYDGGDETYVTATEYNNGDKELIFTTPATINGSGIVFSNNNAGDSGGSIDNVVLVVNP